MAEYLSRFSVVGLHGYRTIDVRLTENKLILVGENGTGKSTFVNLMYYFLTKQWNRLHQYRFTRLEAQFGEHVLVLTPEHLDQRLTARQQLSRFLSASRRSNRTHAVDEWMEFAVHDPSVGEIELTERMAIELGLPMRVVREVMKETKDKPSHLQTIEKHLGETDQGQFLYLPTYRRIEQDLRSIFRGVDVDSELRKFQERLTRRSGASYIELVEFGMEDVEKTIAGRMAHIKENVRTGLDNLTGTYLRDVIRGVHTKVDVQSLGEIDAKALDAVFARIDEATLPTPDKIHLRERVAALSAGRTLDEQDKVVAHFLSKLIDLYTEQQADEKDVRDFVSLCNGYLTGKQLVYDKTKYNILISGEQGMGSSDESLQLRALSSGEKQIVSLFSHLYLSGQRRFFVVIDEPELSLSVPWQRRFLPDIVGTGMCSGLVAVTHSPFVWDNHLEPYVRALAEFTARSSMPPHND